VKKTYQNAPKVIIWRSKVKTFSGEGTLPPPQTPSPVRRGSPPPHTLLFSAPTAPRLSRQRRSTLALRVSMFHTPITFLHPQSSFSRNMPRDWYSVYWPLMGGLLHSVQRGGAWAGCDPALSPPRCTKSNSPPTNGQYTNFILFDMAI